MRQTRKAAWGQSQPALALEHPWKENLFQQENQESKKLWEQTVCTIITTAQEAH